MKTPRLYATFLLWMLAQLFDKLPEVGDPDKPKLVFFFDEAHLLFNEAPKALLDQVERVTRLIRSKGVGVYYVTQNPRDVPNSVSAQLGNRIQHALRAFTPIEQKGIRAAAETFRPNPALDVERVIQELKVGEALVSVLQKGGEPSMVQRTLIRPPSARIGPITPDQRKSLIEASPLLRQVRGNRRSRLRLRDAAEACRRSCSGPGGRRQQLGQYPDGRRRHRAAARAMARPSPSRSSARWRAASAGRSPARSSAGARRRDNDHQTGRPRSTDALRNRRGPDRLR